MTWSDSSSYSGGQGKHYYEYNHLDHNSYSHEAKEHEFWGNFPLSKKNVPKCDIHPFYNTYRAQYFSMSAINRNVPKETKKTPILLLLLFSRTCTSVRHTFPRNKRAEGKGEKVKTLSIHYVTLLPLLLLLCTPADVLFPYMYLPKKKKKNSAF